MQGKGKGAQAWQLVAVEAQQIGGKNLAARGSCTYVTQPYTFPHSSPPTAPLQCLLPFLSLSFLICPLTPSIRRIKRDQVLEQPDFLDKPFLREDKATPTFRCLGWVPHSAVPNSATVRAVMSPVHF